MLSVNQETLRTISVGHCANNAIGVPGKFLVGSMIREILKYMALAVLLYLILYYFTLEQLPDHYLYLEISRDK